MRSILSTVLMFFSPILLHLEFCVGTRNEITWVRLLTLLRSSTRISHTHTHHTGPGDPILRFRLDELKSPPQYHCFGHDHDYFGVSQNSTTTFLNAANQQFLSNESGWDEVFRSGGCPLVFDVMLKSDSSSTSRRGRIGSME